MADFDDPPESLLVQNWPSFFDFYDTLKSLVLALQLMPSECNSKEFLTLSRTGNTVYRWDKLFASKLDNTFFRLLQSKLCDHRRVTTGCDQSCCTFKDILGR